MPIPDAAALVILTLLGTFAWCSVAGADSGVALDNVIERDDGTYTLAPGPKVEGVFLLHQGPWSPEIVRVFHETEWLDGASSRVPWSRLEPADQEFDFAIFDQLLAEVKRYNAEHPGARRLLHVRPLGGRFCPAWFEDAGVRFYDTTHPEGPRAPHLPIRVPVPYDNPGFLRQLREMYRALLERYGDEPLVAVYHGTWSAGPWDEIFHPQGDAPLPPGYTKEKFVGGMVEQLDVLIDEWCARGVVAELPYSGKYPQKAQIDVTGPINERIVERLGKHSPYLFIQSNGWGMTGRGVESICWGHETDIDDARAAGVNIALQAIGTNAGGGWLTQGDWVNCIELAKRYDVPYVEIYPPDLMPVDDEHRIVGAFTADGSDGFLGFRPWLRQRARALYVREGIVRKRFTAGGAARRIASVDVDAMTPEDTSVVTRVRVRLVDGTWGEWRDGTDVAGLPDTTEAEVEVVLRTDDALRTPRVRGVSLTWR